MSTPKGLGWLVYFVGFCEGTIEFWLSRISRRKEEVLLPRLRCCLPAWLSPNHLTALRLVLCVGIIGWLLGAKSGSYQNNYWLALVFLLAALTDFFDGPVARALNKESRQGALLDKVVDKLLVLPLGTAEFWALDKALVVLSIGGTVIAVVVSVYKYLEGKTEVPENIFGKIGMNGYCLAILIAIMPAWQSLALKVAWASFFFGLSSIMVNFSRHFKIGVFRS